MSQEYVGRLGTHQLNSTQAEKSGYHRPWGGTYAVYLYQDSWPFSHFQGPLHGQSHLILLTGFRGCSWLKHKGLWLRIPFPARGLRDQLGMSIGLLEPEAAE